MIENIGKVDVHTMHSKNNFDLIPLDVMIVGALGVGKSSTLNALVGKSIATIGNSFYSMTEDIQSYNLSSKVRIWDTPGIGDSYLLSDVNNKMSMGMLLRTKAVSSAKWYGLIDLVLLIVDASCKDLQATEKILNEIVLKNIAPYRVLLAINKVDQALDGDNWNKRLQHPNELLSHYLDELSWQVENRINESTGINVIRPVCYSAKKGYNIRKLKDYILENVPKQKRIMF